MIMAYLNQARFKVGAIKTDDKTVYAKQLKHIMRSWDINVPRQAFDAMIKILLGTPASPISVTPGSK